MPFLSLNAMIGRFGKYMFMIGWETWREFKTCQSKIFRTVKSIFFAFKTHLNQNFLIGNLFSTRNIHFAWLLKAKNLVFNPGQKFCLRQFQFCPGQKIFCPSRRTWHKSHLKQNFLIRNLFLTTNIHFAWPLKAKI